MKMKYVNILNGLKDRTCLRDGFRNLVIMRMIRHRRTCTWLSVMEKWMRLLGRAVPL